MKYTFLLAFVLGMHFRRSTAAIAYHSHIRWRCYPRRPSLNAGQVVYDDGRDLLIGGKGSYATILTETGYAQKAGKRKLFFRFPEQRLEQRRRFFYDVHRPIVILSSPEPYAKIFGDSVFPVVPGDFHHLTRTCPKITWLCIVITS